MSLTQNGIDYICQNFGDESFCCVETGLSWFYTAEGTPYQETGGTAQIVSRLASGLITDLTMTFPNRGTFTKADLDQANGEPVTLQDAQEVALHDSEAEGQWCYGTPPPPICEQISTQAECINQGCYWYDDGCHTDPYEPPPPPPPQEEFPWLVVGAVGAGIIGAVILYKVLKK